MRSLILLATIATLSVVTVATDIPPFYDFPVFKIDLDLPPAERFVEVATVLQTQIQKMLNDYLHLAPRFVRNFFAQNEDILAQQMPEYYAEIQSMAQILGFDTHLVLMLNYAFELDQALCTSIVARLPDGKVLHGRNQDFAFPDAMRNATFRGQFYKGGKMLFESIQFGGYVGVATSNTPGQFSMSLNSRGGGGEKGVQQYFRIMNEIVRGLPDIGVATREALVACQTYDCMQEQMLAVRTVTPIYLIMAGTQPNQGTVISKGFQGADNIRVLDEDNWYLVQTNDDHFNGVCQTRCQDAIEHMELIGKDNISYENLLTDVILQPHTLNSFTILTMMTSPSEGKYNAYGFDSDTPYVAQGISEEQIL